MYLEDFFLKTPLWIYLISFQNFFPKFELPNSGCGLSASAAYTPVFTEHLLYYWYFFECTLKYTYKISARIVAFRPQHLKWVHNPWFTPLSETMSIRDLFICEFLPQGQYHTVKYLPNCKAHLFFGGCVFFVWLELMLQIIWTWSVLYRETITC